MSKIINYIFNMMPYMAISIPIVLLFIVFKYKKNKKTNLYHEITLFIFIVFLTGLASQTVLPKFEIELNRELVIQNRWYSKINLIPFKVIFDTYFEVFKNENINYFIINFLGNIIMFMPIGFFTSLLWRVSDKKAVLIGFSCSLCIEVCQLFISRGTDIDDLILNTFGAFLGLLVYKLLYKKWSLQIERFKK